MRASRSFCFALSLTLGLAAGISGSGRADDTDIYLGGELIGQDQVKPNVLFVLDTSGSMAATVSGTGLSRLDNMKQALKTILDQSNNINVGLMRFTDPGGPILFPVADIDADAAEVEAGGDGAADVIAQIPPGSSDDASELDVTNLVDTINPKLIFGRTPPQTGGDTIEVRLDVSADDATETLSNGSVSLTATRLNLQNGRLNALRFPGVNVPFGVNVTDARIVLTAGNNDTSAVSVTFSGQAADDPTGFSTASGDLSGRPRTTNSVTWSPPSFSTNSSYTTPNLAAIVQELVNRPGWNPGQAMAFLVDHDGTSGRRRPYSRDGAGGTLSRRPVLQITYEIAVPEGSNSVGLRFNDVGIPQGAVITSARIEFTAASDSGDPTAVLAVAGENAADPETFSNTSPNKISDRPRTGTEILWQGAELPDWEAGNLYQTPDLSAVVQEIVDRPDWCGNNSMAFIIDRVGGDLLHAPREAWSSDATGDPDDPDQLDIISAQGQPTLRIDFDYDPDNPPAGSSGCINQILQRQIAISSDDARQAVSTGGMLVNGILTLRNDFINGLRFQEINIPQGATILEAQLIYNVRATNTDEPAQNTWRGQAIDDAPTFTTNTNDISSRATTTAFVSALVEPWDTAGAIETSPDITPVIQEIVNRPGWEMGNSLAIIQSTSSGTRRPKSYDDSPGESPILRIKVAYGGTLLPPTIKTVRQRLKEMVDTLPARGFTPIVGALYEAARYYRGEGVVHGRARSHRATDRPFTRVSHPASYTGGTVVREPGCTDSNLGSSDCSSEFIDGDPIYISPIGAGCQANYIVLLTDGAANHNANEDGFDHGVSLARDLVGGSCQTTVSGELCGRDLAQFLATQDQRPDLPGEQFIKTYSVGFNFTSDFARDIAQLGGGQYFEAETAGQLAAVFQAIFTEILAENTSFATPSLTVNAFNKLFHRNEVYFSLFQPSTKVRWPGNVKKYQLCDLDQFTDCTLGEVLDADANPAIGTDSRIKDTARSIWSTDADGRSVITGGAAAQVPNHAFRRIYTYTGAGAPSNVTLNQAQHLLAADNTALTKTLLGDATMDDTEREELIAWIRGRDVDDEDGDGNTTENRFTFEDPLHASPVAVTYGGTDADPVIKIFAPTNGGGIRMLNGITGEEEWMFIPQELLAMQRQLRANPAGNHLYGLDLTPTIWVQDNNGNGIIEPANGDFVRVIFGMRRGGRNLYGIDATPTATITDPTATGNALPKLMWRIQGGVGDFAKLGQSWSRPQITRILTRSGGPGSTNSQSSTVMIFGGGNDPDLDASFGPTLTMGNALFIANPATGAFIWSASNSGATLNVPGMDYPITSDIGLLDSNGDGNVNRLYAGDLGGNVWRVDLGPLLATNSNGGTIAGKLADISLSAGAVPGPLGAETRKFYHGLDVVQVNDFVFSEQGRYDLVVITSGSRPTPLSQVVHDRVYAFRDFATEGLTDNNADGLADGYPTLTHSDLADLTDNPLQANADGSFQNPVAANDFIDDPVDGFRISSGWFIEFKETDGSFIGEKGLAKPVVLAGKLFFTTYVPEITQALINECRLAEGEGRLYGINVLTGAALFAEWNDAGGTDPVTADRFYALGGGIPSEAVPIFQKEGVTIIVGGGGGATTVDPGIDLPRARTYWYQE